MQLNIAFRYFEIYFAEVATKINTKSHLYRLIMLKPNLPVKLQPKYSKFISSEHQTLFTYLPKHRLRHVFFMYGVPSGLTQNVSFLQKRFC